MTKTVVSANELNLMFQTVRELLAKEMTKKTNQNNESALVLAGALTAGMTIVESALLDLKRSADALERLADNDSDRRVEEEERGRG